MNEHAMKDSHPAPATEEAGFAATGAGAPDHHAEPAEEPRKAGQAARNPGNFANDRAKAVEAGRRGGQRSHGGGGAGNNPGNFANNRQRAAEAGRKGGMQPRR